VRLVALSATAILAAALPLSAATTPNGASNRLLLAHGAVKNLAADGHLAALDVVTASKGKTCHRIAFWKGSGKARFVKAGCADRSTHDQNVTALALAGTRVLWVDYEYGNHAYCSLMTATPTRTRPVDTGFCSAEDADVFLGGLAGDGQLLVFDSWYEDLDGRVSDVGLYSLVGTKARRILSGAKARTVTSVSSGLIAIREAGGAVAAYRSEGSLVHLFAVHALSAKLDGARRLVVRTATKLQPWDLGTAVDLAPRPLQGGKLARFEDVQSGIAVYIVERAVHLLRLSDGHDVVITKAKAGPVHAQLEPPGLFYSTRNGVEFVPMATVRRALG
jgi:hypothetical protein